MWNNPNSFVSTCRSSHAARVGFSGQPLFTASPVHFVSEWTQSSIFLATCRSSHDDSFGSSWERRVYDPVFPILTTSEGHTPVGVTYGSKLSYSNAESYWHLDNGAALSGYPYWLLIAASNCEGGIGNLHAFVKGVADWKRALDLEIKERDRRLGHLFSVWNQALEDTAAPTLEWANIQRDLAGQASDYGLIFEREAHRIDRASAEISRKLEKSFSGNAVAQALQAIGEIFQHYRSRIHSWLFKINDFRNRIDKRLAFRTSAPTTASSPNSKLQRSFRLCLTIALPGHYTARPC